MKLLFGDIVVVEGNLIGVIVKTWVNYSAATLKRKIKYDVYVREYNSIKEYPEEEVERYKVRHKYLNEEELEYQEED